MATNGWESIISELESFVTRTEQGMRSFGRTSPTKFTQELGRLWE